MCSNSKLTQDQKTFLKESKKEDKTLKFVNNGKTTFAYHRNNKLVIFATSIMSDDEMKFRRKVGEFYALSRLASGECSILEYYDFISLLEIMGIDAD